MPPKYFVGTSNFQLAREYRLEAIGTVAHEYYMTPQAFTNVALSQKIALDVWDDVFRGRLGIALTDIIGSGAFREDFDYKYANSFGAFAMTQVVLSHGWTSSSLITKVLVLTK